LDDVLTVESQKKKRWSDNMVIDETVAANTPVDEDIRQKKPAKKLSMSAFDSQANLLTES